MVLATIVFTMAVPKSNAADNHKISARVLGETANGGSTEALVVLAQQANLAPAAALSTKLAKGQFVVNALRDVASRTQTPLITLFKQRGVPYRSFWAVNMIQVTGNGALMRELAARADVKQIDANPHVKTALPVATAFDTEQVARIEWNVTKVKAPKVWKLGFKGEGMVVAGADTGVQWDHPALKGHYRGWTRQSCAGS